MKLRLTMIVGALAASVLLMSGAFAQTDTATPEATPAAAESAASPVAEESIRVTTMVMWYQPSSSGDFVEIGPLATNNQLIAGPGDPTTAVTGTIDFTSPDNDELPRIEFGDSVFDAYAPQNEAGTVFRWIYFDGDPSARPATLVLQVEAVEGPYKGAQGLATFSSRSSPGSGVLVIMLNPPESS